MEVLTFIFQDFLHFVGVWILLSIVMEPFCYLFGKRD
jgi:hypothetical protein